MARPMMRRATFRVKEGEVKRVARAIEAFVRAIGRSEPDTLWYASYRTGERDFFHLMTFKSGAAEQRHAAAPYTKRFVAVLYPRCEGHVVFHDVDVLAEMNGGARPKKRRARRKAQKR
jgi:quinol monooxygenase YgiN